MNPSEKGWIGERMSQLLCSCSTFLLLFTSAHQPFNHSVFLTIKQPPTIQCKLKAFPTHATLKTIPSFNPKPKPRPFIQLFDHFNPFHTLNYDIPCTRCLTGQRVSISLSCMFLCSWNVSLNEKKKKLYHKVLFTWCFNKDSTFLFMTLYHPT